MTQRARWIGLIVSIFICFAAAGLGGLVTNPKIPNWYAQLAKPVWTPPDWLFGPVWSMLYLMMAIAAWFVWRPKGFAGAKLPLALFAIQLALNSLWSVLFFGFQRPGAAAVEIVFLVGRDPADADRVLAPFKMGRPAAGAVSDVGELCRGAQLGDLADERVNGGLRLNLLPGR